MDAISNSNLLQSIGWSVFNSLWQMALLWIAYQLIISIFRIKRSSHRGSLAASFLFAGFAWFVITFLSLLSNSDNAQNIYTGGVINIENNAQLNEWFATALPYISVAYLVLLLIPVLNFIRNYRYVQVIRRYGLSKADVYWRIFAQKIASQMGINRPVYVWMSELITSPVTIGYLKPIILLPLASINHLTTQQTEAILLHELAHIKRYDYFINLVARFVRTILYFNPFVKAFGKIIEREREKTCDEAVIQFQYEPHSYASALLTLEKASYIPKQSFAVAAVDGKKGEFIQRIEWIMGIRKKQSFSFAKMAGVMIALFCFIGLNALIIMNRPLNSNGKSDPFTFLSSPLDLNSDDSKQEKTIWDENPAQIVNHSSASSPAVLENKVNETNKNEKTVSENEEMPGLPENLPYQYVAAIQEIIPQLDENQEKNIQEALAESKRVMKETRWKAVEETIADAMTLTEKKKVKEEYTKELDKQMDLEKIENQLRLAYDQIDWGKINLELDHAIAAIKIDSLKTVYTIALSNLSKLQNELVKTKQVGIPDSDITVESIETQKKELQRSINRLRAVHQKKIIHL